MSKHLSLIKRIKTNRLDWHLAFLQLIVAVIACGLIVAAIFWYRHLTEDYFIDKWDYLYSVRIAFPPLLFFFLGYILAFVTGVSLTETPKLIIRYVRNQFLQSPKSMVSFSVIGVIVIGIAIYNILNTTPPHYDLFVSRLLGGESDIFEVANKDLKIINEKNESLARNYSLVIDVFKERNRLNTNNIQPTSSLARVFVRALGTNIVNEDWRKHPLRVHALAESYSMWAQASYTDSVQNGLPGIENSEWKEISEKSLELYRQVATSDSNLATDLLKTSAMHNQANVYLYTGQYRQALSVMEDTLNFNENLSTYSNIIVIYVLLNQPEKAIEKGLEAEKWAVESGKALEDISHFAGVLGNIAVAQMIIGDYHNALVYAQSAFDILDDELSRLNLALALSFQGKKDSAVSTMEGLKVPPLDINNQAQRVRDPIVSPCSYLVWELVAEFDNPQLSAAYLRTYLGQARTAEQLQVDDNDSVLWLRKMAWNKLQKSTESCSDLTLIPLVKRHLLNNSKDP